MVQVQDTPCSRLGGMHCGPDYMSRQGQDNTQSISIKAARVYCINNLLEGAVVNQVTYNTKVDRDKFIGVEDGLISSTVEDMSY